MGEVKNTKNTTTKTTAKKETKKQTETKTETKIKKETNTKKETKDEKTQPKPVFVASKKDHQFVIVDTAPAPEELMEPEEEETTTPQKKERKIPIAIWCFFGCSLLMFCIAFYSAVILPRIQGDPMEQQNSVTVDLAKTGAESRGTSGENIFTVTPPTNDENRGTLVESKKFDESQTSFLFSFYQLMSEKKSDELLAMLHPNLRKGLQANWNSSRLTKLMAHVIGGQIKPTVMDVKNQNGMTTYTYELHYSLDVNSEKSFDEEREMTVQGEGDDAKITNIHCSTHKCSQHPIFWPENFIK